MNCPNCGDVGQPGPVSCQTCRSVFEVSDLERFNHLTFLRERLEQWGVSGLLPEGAATRAAALTLQEIHVCLGRMAGTVPVQPARAAARAIEPRPSVPVARPVATGGSVPAPTRATRLGLPYAAALPRPARPLFSWKQVGTYLLSERTLNGLLGIGAFLILAAAFVISTVNPTGLSPLPHLGMMVATTAVFYAAGTLVRGKLDLTRAGAALLGIGAAFIPLDALTLGRDTLQFDWATNWLGASMLCLPLYLFSHLMLRGRPFALLTTISGGSLLLAAGNQFGAPPPWAYASLSLLAIGYLLLAHRIHREWLALAWALFWTAQSATPFVMAALLAARLLPDSVLSGMPVAWHTALLAQRGANLDYAAGTAWWLGTVFYLLAARTSGQRLYRDIAAWVLPCALLFTLTKAPWDSGWDGFCLIPLAAGYLLYGRFATRLPHRQDGSYRYRDVAREPVFQAALALSLVAAAWPSARFTSEIATLAALSLTFVAAAYLLRQRVWAYVATYLVLVIQVRQLTVPQSYLTAAKHPRLDQLSPALSFALIAGLMLALAECLARASGEARRPFLETALGLGTWRSLFSGALFSAGYLGTILAVWFAFSAGTPLAQFSPTTIAGLFAVVGILAASAAARRTGILLYPAAALLLVPCSALAPQLARYGGAMLSDPALARCLAVLGVGYLILASGLERMGGRYARPLYLAGYLLGLGTVLASIPDRAITVQLIGLTLLTYLWSAWRVHHDRFPSFTWLVEFLPSHTGREHARMLFQYLAIWCFPAWLLRLESLWRSDSTPADYGLVLVALASLYLVLGLVSRRARPEYRIPWFMASFAEPFLVVGQVLCVAGLVLALVSQDPVVAFLAWSLGAIHYAVSYFYRRGHFFNWPLAFTIAVAYVLGLMVTSVTSGHFAAELLPLAAAYLLGTELSRRWQGTAARRTERWNVRSAAAGWSVPFSLIGHIGAFVTCTSAGASAFFGVSAGAGESVTVLWLVAALYGACIAASRSSRWLYPTLAYALAAYEAAVILVPDSTYSTPIVATIAPAWLLLVLSHLVSRAQPRPETPGWYSHPWKSAWARPLLVFGLLALSGSILASFSRPLAGLTMVAAAAYFPLLAVLASLWRDRRLAWGSLLLAAICCQACLILAGTRGVDQPLYWTGAALLAGCLGTMARRAGPFMAALWARPLYVSAAVTWGIALLASTGGLLNNHHALQTPAITLAMGGAACLLAGIRGRRSLYLGVGTALLACAYMLEMFFLNVTQPQAFSLPVGIAVYLLAYLEWRQSTSPGRKNLLEVVAGIGLLGAALLQAIGQLDATGNHLAYAALLLLEGTTVLAFGAALRWTRTFFAGGAAIVAGMLIVVAEPLRNLSVVYLALLIGCAMIALVVFLEQRRRRIPLWIDEVRVGLETWS